MTRWSKDELETLRLEGPLRMGELGRRLGITPSTLTRKPGGRLVISDVVRGLHIGGAAEAAVELLRLDLKTKPLAAP